MTSKKINLKLATTIMFFIISIMADPLVYAQPISYGLNNSQGIPLDLILVEIMNYRDGIFIEVGANDGVTQSNTKLFEEKYGWTGILVEPSENLFLQLCQNRPNSKCFSCALGAFKENNTYVYGDFDGQLMSSLTDRTQRPKTQKVLVRSLQSILDECKLQHINFFSLDVEGYELNILQGIDFTKTTFDYLLIEIYKHQYHDIIAFLAEKEYELVKCLSNFTHDSKPSWDGTHNDYLFRRKNLPAS